MKHLTIFILFKIKKLGEVDEHQEENK